MARAAHSTDFNLTVEGVGIFVFGRRTLGDQIKINVEFARLIEGVEPTAWLDTVGTWLSTLKVLMVRCPEEFVVDDLDPLDDNTYAKLKLIYQALVEQERSFRRKPVPPGPPSGEAKGGDG